MARCFPEIDCEVQAMKKYVRKRMFNFTEVYQETLEQWESRWGKQKLRDPW